MPSMQPLLPSMPLLPSQPLLPSMQSLLPSQPLLPVTPTPFVNPLIGGLSNPLADPTLQYVYMLNRYGSYSMPYGAPALSYGSALNAGGKSRMNDVVVQLPIASAKVLVNGVETNGSGASTRHLAVPDGQNHEAKINAVWTIDGKTKSEERTVHLSGSGHQVVNFLVPKGK
jgi:hypothetical protein